VVAALIKRFHEAKLAHASSVTVWGTGTPRREFLHVDDFADACVFVLQNYSAAEPINIGCGEDIAIAEFAEQVAEVTGFAGTIVYDRGKPDGTPRKLVDISRLSALGWRPKISLRQGLASTYADFVSHAAREG
jgi:GDP-L-fucose synthase